MLPIYYKWVYRFYLKAGAFACGLNQISVDESSFCAIPNNAYLLLVDVNISRLKNDFNLC